MIIGIGIDTVAVSRIARLIEERGDQFLKKVFTKREIEEGLKRKDSSDFFAARFAAREAFLKALGTGYGRGLGLKEIGVAASDLGQPRFEFSERAMEALKGRGADTSHLSLTHDGGIAIAVAILEKA